jgi:hypothetical protein
LAKDQHFQTGCHCSQTDYTKYDSLRNRRWVALESTEGAAHFNAFKKTEDYKNDAKDNKTDSRKRIFAADIWAVPLENAERQSFTYFLDRSGRLC